MALEITTCSSTEELRDGLDAIGHYFGFEQQLEDVERLHTAARAGADAHRTRRRPDRRRRRRLSVPPLDPRRRDRCRRRDRRRRAADASSAWGAHGDDARAARRLPRARRSRSPTSGRPRRRSTAGSATGWRRSRERSTIAKDRAQFAQPFEPRGSVRLVDPDEALQTFPPLYEQCFAQRPGMFARKREWWELRRLHDDPSRRRGGGPKNLVLLELDGAPAGYAIYNVKQDWAGGVSAGTVSIVEAVAPTPEATRELWRWLLDFDWTSQFSAGLLPVDHPLFLLLAEPRRMNFTLGDGVWVRLLDVGAALSARGVPGRRRDRARDRGPVPARQRGSLACDATAGAERTDAERRARARCRRARLRRISAASRSPSSCRRQGA